MDTNQFVSKIGYGAVFGSRTFRGGSIAFKEIVSTGRLSIIRDEQLRRSLMGYYSDVEASVLALKEYNSGYLQKINSLRPFDPKNSSVIHPLDIQLILQTARTKEFYLLTNAEITFAHQTIEYVQIFKAEAAKIILEIDAYLGNHVENLVSN